MHEAILYDKLGNGKVRCRVCPRACVVADGRSGYCCVRANHEGSLYALTYGKITSAAPTNSSQASLGCRFVKRAHRV
jgi:pyruvate formate lyase activating enzyme